MTLCKYCGNKVGTDLHHLIKRSIAPELIDDLKNKVLLCRECHNRTETDIAFYEALQQIFFYWKPYNVDLFVRAQATVDAINMGLDVEFITPQLTDAYLQEVSAYYSYVSEQLATLEQREALFLEKGLEENKKKALLEVKWSASEDGQNMIVLKRKEKTLEKTMSNLRQRLNRFNTERFIK